MKFDSLEVSNFRQFFGTQKLSFAGDEKRNVTIIYGANGSGKTTLLNAFTWCLYGKFTPAFESPDRLVNERAFSEASPGDEITAQVRLRFMHDDTYYELTRTRVLKKQGLDHTESSGGDRVILLARDALGATMKLENPGDAVKQMLPERLYAFFFFDGERVEQIVKPQAYEEIEDAIKTVLGLEVLERASNDLPEAKRLLTNQLKRLGNVELDTLATTLDKHRGDLERLQAERQTRVLNGKALESQLDEVNEALRNMDVARELQHRSDTLEDQLKAAELHQTSLSENLTKLISRKGYLAFAGPLVTVVRTAAEDNRAKGQLPAPIQKQFVQDLLSAGRCICGTALATDSEAQRHVHGWLARGGSAEIEVAWSAITAYCNAFDTERQETCTEIKRILSDIVLNRQQQHSLEQHVSEVSRQLKDLGSVQVKSYAATKEKLASDLKENDKLIWEYDNEIKSTAELVGATETRLESAKIEDERVRVIQKQLRAIESVRDVVTRILEMRKEGVRAELDAAIKAFYREVAFKPYVPEVTPTFQVQLRKSVGGEEIAVAKGQGENQLLSLSFVGALARLARDRYDQRSAHGSNQLLSYQGGIYPVVMDSPFGALDENYRKEVAHVIPALAPQVVIFVSRAQGAGVVKAELDPRIGKEFVISYYTPKGDAREELFEIDGHGWPYIERSNNGFEWAAINGVNAGV